MRRNLRNVGREAEDRAAEYLIEQGFTIVTRRYKAPRGELDLVALDGDELVFVEVKLRSDLESLPELSIGDEKIRSLIHAAECYRTAVGETTRSYRFDVIALDRTGLRHHRRVFQF